jgi:hypothetical protein
VKFKSLIRPGSARAPASGRNCLTGPVPHLPGTFVYSSPIGCVLRVTSAASQVLGAQVHWFQHFSTKKVIRGPQGCARGSGASSE